MRQPVIGWDIGGAHLKAALFDTQGQLVRVVQQVCPLWLGLDQLHNALRAILAEFDQDLALHAITMTGELVDLFSNRESGVREILSAMASMMTPESMMIFAGRDGFIHYADLSTEFYPAIASANWLATLRYLALQRADGLLIDIGSTTTDILLFQNHREQAIGFTDYERLVSGELIYTGIIRTAVMAVAQRAVFNGQEQGLMAEYFATMADVYRLTGELNEVHDQTQSADGGDKTLVASALRLSRMTGYDFVETDLERWRQFAVYLRNRQLQLIQFECERQLSRQLLPSGSCFVGAGVGRFLVKRLADQLGYAYLDFDDFFTEYSSPISLLAADCAPAVAVAQLL